MQQTDISKVQQVRDRLTVDLRRLIRHELEAEERVGPYILLAGIDPGVTLGEDIKGITCPSMSEIYRDSIENYDGPGPAMILNPDVPIPEVTATAAHEISHRLLAETLCLELPSQSYAQAVRDYVEGGKWQDDQSTEGNRRAELIAARKEHSLAFIRMAIHVSSRLLGLGWSSDTFELLRWREVTNTRSFMFFDVLRDECHDLRNEPLSAIKTIPPPTGFNSLFEPPESFRSFFGE